MKGIIYGLFAVPTYNAFTVAFATPYLLLFSPVIVVAFLSISTYMLGKHILIR